MAAEAGAVRVELATPLLTVGEDLDVTNKPSMYRRLAKNGVVQLPNQILAGQQDGDLLLRDVWSEEQRVIQDVDLIVFAGHQETIDGLQDALSDAEPDIDVYLLGDSVAPRLIRDAVHEGVRVGNAI